MKFITIIIALFFISNSSCKRMQGHSKIAALNNSDYSIIITSILNVDTILCVSSSNKINFSNPIELKAGEQKNDFLVTYNEGWESRLSRQKYYVYFFNKDTFNNNSCDTFVGFPIIRPL